MILKTRVQGGAALCLAALAATAQAAGWDAAADLTAASTTNPNGVWRYGYDSGPLADYQLKLFDTFPAEPGLLIWRDGSYNVLGAPALAKNIGSSPNASLAPGQMGLHPGATPDGDAAILRFTAPGDDAYDITAQFFAATGQTDAWVVKNGDFGNPLSALGVTATNPVYSATALWLMAGDTLDFVVGNHGNFFSDMTPLSVQITSVVPEPGAAALALAGLAALAAVVRRRSPKNI